MTSYAPYSIMVTALTVGILAVSDSAVAAPAAETPLQGLTRASIMQYATGPASCYGLEPLAAELLLKNDATQILASAGLSLPLPTPPPAGSNTTTVPGPFIYISDSVVKLNEVNCFDKVVVTVSYPTRVKLEHNGQMFLAHVPLWSSESMVIGGGKQDYLQRREAAIAQMFTELAQDWKRQNGR